MNFLAPLFLIGAAGIAIPIALHLIRRQAKGRQDFSSLMFLDPSTPTMLQRSRIDQWLLLLLRGLAIVLLAAAFARPYWKTQLPTEMPLQEVQRALLVDVSASMQREGLWSSAIDAINEAIKTAQPRDSLSLYAFDDRVQTLISTEEARASSPENRADKIHAALKSVRPSDRGTNLGLALATVSERLVRTEETDKDRGASQCEILLISDFQSGSEIDCLENFQWPTECKLAIKIVDSKNSENVSASILTSKQDLLTTTVANLTSAPSTTNEGMSLKDGLVVRLTNHDSRKGANVSLRWLDQDDRTIEESQVNAEVVADGNIVVRVPNISQEAIRLRLEGDTATFDNDRFVAKPPKRALDITCLDREQREATESLGYFLNQLPFDDETRDVRFTWRSPESSDPWPDKNTTPLVVVSHDMLDSDASLFKSYLEGGGHGLWVLDQPLDMPSSLKPVEAQWKILTGEAAPVILEAKAGRDAMFETIDFKHPIFQSLSDSKFNDFTKIRFWRHRCIDFSEDKNWTTIACFDDKSPAISFRPVGQGILWLFASGWQPSESQLALSSKFVPILSAMFSLAAPLERNLNSLVTGSRIECLEGENWFDTLGSAANVEIDSDGMRSIVFDKPGFYRVMQENQTRWVAVNLPIAESKTNVMEIEQLERLGVRTSDSNFKKAAMDKREQLHGVELEAQQRLWQWLMIGMLGALVFETIWGMNR